MTAFFTRLGVFLLWALHWLPLSLQAMIGDLVGWLAYFLTSRRRKVAQRNLELCFPEMSGPEIRRLVRRNFQASVRAVLEHGLLIWASGERLRRIIRVEGQEHLDDNMGEPLILLAPHFIGLDMAGARLAMMDTDGLILCAGAQFHRQSLHVGTCAVVSTSRNWSRGMMEFVP